VRLLLDTHIALWAITGDSRLPTKATDLIVDQENEVFVSVASLWEIAVKYSLNHGKPTDMPVSAQDALGYFHDAGYALLDIVVAHVLAVGQLPTLHSDPFDRMLVAQSLTVPLRLITHDARVARYSDTIIAV
jgi:PIN domain nuclease of toxin-antitoxin system